MTTNYAFQATYTKLGVATSPSVAPTLKVVDSNNNIVLNDVATNALTNIAGLYKYIYNGVDGLKLYGLFHTDDSTVDTQDIASYPQDSLLNIPSVENIWSYSDRSLTVNEVVTASSPTERYAQLSQEPGKLDITMLRGNDLSFDIDLGIDITLYDTSAFIAPFPVGSTEIPIVITPTDLTLGKLNFYISDTSIALMNLLTDKHRWYFNLSTPKAVTLPPTVFTRTILAGYLNLKWK